ncbi:MAG TPA: hypothetical protein VG841_06345 [Caulobacterales bacterium]|nr:hypothetical protein [Caulobacterales bacterium]
MRPHVFVTNWRRAAVAVVAGALSGVILPPLAALISGALAIDWSALANQWALSAALVLGACVLVIALFGVPIWRGLARGGSPGAWTAVALGASLPPVLSAAALLGLIVYNDVVAVSVDMAGVLQMFGALALWGASVAFITWRSAYRRVTQEPARAFI